jgi:hypothetical protein
LLFFACAISLISLVNIYFFRSLLSYNVLKWETLGMAVCVLGLSGSVIWWTLVTVRDTSKRKAAT